MLVSVDVPLADVCAAAIATRPKVAKRVKKRMFVASSKYTGYLRRRWMEFRESPSVEVVVVAKRNEWQSDS